MQLIIGRDLEIKDKKRGNNLLLNVGSKPGSQNRYRAFYTLKIILVIL